MRTNAGIGFLLAAVIGGWAGWWRLGSPATVLAQEPGTPTEGQLDFARDVQPLFERHCYDCHGPDTQESGLLLSSRKSALAGGDSG
ncbi:MAG: c-type cytochrome domain-containing protein, partial [Pirellulales bacterium]